MISSLLTRLFQRRAPRTVPRPRPARRPRMHDDGIFYAPIPALDNYGLKSIESRLAKGAPVHQVQRWIGELERQMPTMHPAVRQYAKDLLIKMRGSLCSERLQILNARRMR